MTFKNRIKIIKNFKKWCETNDDIKPTPDALLAYLVKNEWLNDEKILNDIKEAESEDKE